MNDTLPRPPSMLDPAPPNPLDVMREAKMRKIRALRDQIDAEKAELAGIEQLIALDKNRSHR